MLLIAILIGTGIVLAGVGIWNTPPYTETERKERTEFEERGERPPKRPWRWYDTSASAGGLLIVIGLLVWIVPAIF